MKTKNYDFKQIYNYLPSSFQNALVSIYGVLNDSRRYGLSFDEALEKVIKQDADAEKLKEIQAKLLSDFIKHAENSNYWKRRFLEFSLDVNGDPFVEIKKLPVITKSEVRDNASDIVIPVASMRKRSTSGSTGAGLSFFGDKEFEAIQWAVWWRYWLRYGIRRDMWCAHFGGKTVVPIHRKTPPYYRVNYFSRQVMFSAYHLSSSSVVDYISVLNSKKIKWLHGYASVIAELARLATNRGLKLDYKVDFISLGSENVTQTHERVIYEFFGVKPIQHYGLAEGVANFSNKPGCSGLAVDEDFAFVEFLPAGDQLKIVGTNFNNYAFPLIRYDTGDLASGLNECVFPRVVERIDGRQDDYVCLPTGERVGRVASVFNEFDFIDESQLVQTAPDSIVVRVVSNSRWTEDSESKVLRALRLKLGGDIDMNFEYVDAVQRTSSGKVRFVISEV